MSVGQSIEYRMKVGDEGRRSTGQNPTRQGIEEQET